LPICAIAYDEWKGFGLDNEPGGGGQEGPVMGYVSTLMSIQSAFEKAGIRFLDNEPGGGIGVRLSEQKKS
jgi:hypothetical protein